MSNIQNLTDKIKEEAKVKASEILQVANLEASKIIELKQKEASKVSEEIINKANIEASAKEERIISNATLSVRNKKLQAKQEIIEKTLKRAVVLLSNLSADDYKAFVKRSIESLDLKGNEKVIINKKSESIITEEFIKSINSNLTLSSERRQCSDGVIVERNGIETNFTFEALVNSLKDSLEFDVANKLFS